jgi:hypothetical protein
MRREFSNCSFRGGLLAATLSVLLANPANAIDLGPYQITLQADARWVQVDSPYASFTEGGLGLSRFDEDHDGLRVGRVLVNFNGPLTETLRADITLSGTGDSDVNALDVTEAFIEWRPYPSNRWRWRTRLGAFYPPVSLENRAVGWQSIYSISPAAINTWFGEEIRAIGVEQAVTLTSANPDHSELSFIASLYQWNDPMGVLLFQRGWAIHDRQTALFDELPRPFPRFPNEATINFFREIDNRIGYYVAVDYKLERNLTVRAAHYDNRGDPAVKGYKDTAWLSRFDAVGARYELPTQTTLIAQWLKGDTAFGPSPDGRGMFIIDFWSYFGLLSQQVGAHRLTARYDRMTTEPIRGQNFFESRQNASAWTFAYLWDISEAWQLAVEQVDLRGSLAQRARRGLPTFGHERTFQVALRFSL